MYSKNSVGRRGASAIGCLDLLMAFLDLMKLFESTRAVSVRLWETSERHCKVLHEK